MITGRKMYIEFFRQRRICLWLMKNLHTKKHNFPFSIFHFSLSWVVLPAVVLGLLLSITAASGQNILQDSMNQTTYESQFQDSIAAAGQEPVLFTLSGNNQFNIAGLIAKTIGYLLLIVVLILVAVYVLKRFVYNRRELSGYKRAIKVVSSTYIAPKKSLMLIEAAGRLLLLSVTDNGMNLITELKKEEYEEYLQSENADKPLSDPPGRQFGELLHRFLKRSKS